MTCERYKIDKAIVENSIDTLKELSKKAQWDIDYHFKELEKARCRVEAFTTQIHILEEQNV